VHEPLTKQLWQFSGHVTKSDAHVPLVCRVNPVEQFEQIPAEHEIQFVGHKSAQVPFDRRIKPVLQVSQVPFEQN
jgi:hypothetical protein